MSRFCEFQVVDVSSKELAPLPCSVFVPCSFLVMHFFIYVEPIIVHTY